MVNHALSQLQEKLAKYLREQDTFRHKHVVNANSVAVDNRIKSIKREINELGAVGRLIMAICVVKRFIFQDNYEPQEKIETFTLLFHDLDDYSIYKLINSYYGEKCISKSLVEIPLKTPLPASLNDKFISWQINP